MEISQDNTNELRNMYADLSGTAEKISRYFNGSPDADYFKGMIADAGSLLGLGGEILSQFRYGGNGHHLSNQSI